MSLEVNIDAVNTVQTSSVNEDGNRAPRLPRWTRGEILVLIQGKKVAENRVRRGRSIGSLNQVIEPKWASVSSYCKRHGVNRGPVQCRKRWSNLAGDFKKIKEWELVHSNKSGESESFWVMRNDLRRERKLPGFFDKEVYDILDGGSEMVISEKLKEVDEELSEDYDPQGQEEQGGDDLDKETVAIESPKASPLPVSEKVYEPSYQDHPISGTGNEKEVASNTEKLSPPREERKRKRSPSEDRDTHLGEQLVNVLEQNGMILTRQLEAQNTNCVLDRDQRKDQGNSLVTVLNKLADALVKIADKL